MSHNVVNTMRRLQGDLSLTPAEIERRAAAKKRQLALDQLVPDLFMAQLTADRPAFELPFLRVGVIGAGFAGLAAAWYLEQCGVDVVTVYEASDRVGGRVLTDSSFIPARIVESGAELIGTNHPMWNDLAGRFGRRLVELTDDEDYEKAGLAVRLRIGATTFLKPDIDAIDARLLPIIDAIGRDARPIHPNEPWSSPGATRFDGMSVADRFNELFGLASSVDRTVLEFTVGNDNCAPVADQSYLGLLAAVSAGRMGSDTRGMRGYWEFTETHRCGSGNQDLATELAATLSDLRRSTPVVSVEIIGSGDGAPVTVTDEFGNADVFDFVILAAPATVWSSITFDPPFTVADRTMQHGRAVKFLGHYPTAFWETLSPPLAPSAAWNELGTVWESTDNQFGPNFDAGLTVFSGGSFVLSSAAYTARMATFFGGSPVKQRLEDWPAEAFIRTGYSVPAVGQVRTVARELSRPHLNRLFFAGEQASPGFFGYMEGALQSGGRAARDIVMRSIRFFSTIGPLVPPSPPRRPLPAPPPVPLPPFLRPFGPRSGQLRRIDGADYAVVQLNEMFAGPGPTIAELAAGLHLQADITFHCLLGYRSNAPAVVGLFKEVFPEEPVPELEEARRRLRIEGTTFTANEQFPQGTETPYLAWRVRPGDDKPVVLPLSDGFRRVIDEGTRERQRQTRLKAIEPALDALRAELPAIRVQARALETDIGLCRGLAESHARDVAIIEALDGLLGALLAAPKAPASASDRREVEDLRALLAGLRSESHRHMLLEPADSFRAGLHAQRAQNAAALRALVEAPQFVDHVRTLADNRDVAPQELYREAIDTVGFAFQTLLASPESERVVEAHVRPMADALASRPIDLGGLAAPLNPELDAAIRAVPAPPAPSSVLVVLVGIAGVLPQTIGNYPGPNALAVGVLQWAAPHLLSAVASNRGQANALAGRLYRALVTCASVGVAPGGAGPPRPLSLAERVALLEAIDQGNLSRLRDVDWSARFQTSPAWGAAIAVASAICLYAAIQSDDASTLRRWSNILGSASGTALGVSVAVGRYSTLVQQGIVRGIGGRALGLVGGAAAIVSGVVTAEEEYESGDTVGMWVGIGTATGGALSVAGFLLSAGAGTTATVAGAPVGVVLMVAGAALGIGAGIVALIRQVTTEGSEAVFEAMLAHYGRDFGPFDEAASVRPSLRAAFEAVESAQHGVGFWDVHPDRAPELSDLGFGDETIALIVAESLAEVSQRLQVAGRDQAVPVP